MPFRAEAGIVLVDWNPGLPTVVRKRKASWRGQYEIRVVSVPEQFRGCHDASMWSQAPRAPAGEWPVVTRWRAREPSEGPWALELHMSRTEPCRSHRPWALHSTSDVLTRSL